MPADQSLTILGPCSLTAGQLQSWLAANGKTSAYVSASIGQIAALYISEGTDQGVRGDVAFAQACIETGYFSAPAAAQLLAKNNFAGIAVPSEYSAGDGWPSPQLGVRAHIQLLAKVTGETAANFKHPDVSPGWGGRQAVTWGGLAGNWAADTTYGSKIVSVYNMLLGGSPVLQTDPSTGFTGAVVASSGVSTTTVSNVQTGHIPGISPQWSASATVTASTFQWPLGAAPTGVAAAEALTAAVTTDSNVDLANGQLSQVQLTVVDRTGSLLAGLPGLLDQTSGDVGPYMMWGSSDVMVMAETQTLDTDRIPSMILTLRTGCLQWMATRRVQRVWNGVSATQWVEQCVSEYNDQLPSGVPPATFLGDYTAPYAGGIMANPSMPVTQWQSYYDIAQQLCYDEGCWLFESGGCVVFGRPSWIVTVAPTFKIGYRGPSGDWAYPADADAVATLDYPNCLRSVSLFTGDTLQVDLPRSLGEQVRVGQQFALSGVPYWSGKRWIVTGVQFAYDGGMTPVRVSANEAKDPVPAAPGGVAPSPPQTDPTGHPPQATNLQFVQAALTQIGVPYVWGGETAGVGFDCSGLVQWALQQLGITFPRVSGDQYAACAAVAGANKGTALAATIYGALLFKNSPNGATAGEHVAISMGKTRNGGSEVQVLQAPYTGADVGTAWVPVSYFDEGAIIPQLNYGTAGGTGG